MDIIDAKSKNIELIFEKSEDLEIPLYQRSYDWKESQTETLINDFWSSYIENHEIQYFLGNIIIRGESGKKIIIDGQQRITTITLLIFALANTTRESNWSSEEKEFIIGEKIKNYIYRKPKEIKDKKFALKLVSSIKNSKLENFLEWANPFEHDSSKEIETTNYYINYNILKKFIVENITTPKLMINFWDWIISKVALIEITLPDNLDEHKIFETINAEGASLTSVDLIKNFIYSRIERKVSDEKTKVKLSERTEIIFENHIDKLDKRRKLGEKVLNNFMMFMEHESFQEEGKLFYKKFKNKYSSLDDYNDFICKLFKYTYAYEKISNYKIKELKVDFDIAFFLTKEMISGVLFPIFFVIFENKINENYDIINDNDFIYFVKKLERHTTSSYILSKSNKNYNRFFIEQTLPKLKEKLSLDDIDNLNTKSTIDHLFDDILVTKVEDEITTTITTYEEEILKKNFISKSPYKNEKNMVRHILTKYEYLSKGENSQGLSVADSSDWEIEHVFPQNHEQDSYWENVLNENDLVKKGLDPIDVKDKYIHKWGNLTLLSKEDNKKATNADFIGNDGKKKIITNSLFRINKVFEEYEEWNFENVESRQNLIWEKIWESLKNEVEY